MIMGFLISVLGIGQAWPVASLPPAISLSVRGSV
jgi:hypothetical protein